MESVSTQPLSLYQKTAWDGITVEYIHSDAVGEFDASLPQNAIGVALAPNNKVVWRVDDTETKRVNVCT